VSTISLGWPRAGWITVGAFIQADVTGPDSSSTLVTIPPAAQNPLRWEVADANDPLYGTVP
jgi:hypothetical protein